MMKLKLQQYLLPGVVFQSVLIGGAYATGREIVEYGAKFGAAGIWSIVAIGLGFSVISAVCYEFARVTGSYDYHTLVRRLIGPAWPLFDLLYLAMVVVVIAVVSAASGAIAEQVLGVPYWAGVVAVIALVATINAAGRRIIENFKSIGSALLYVGYMVFAGSVLRAGWPQVRVVLATADTSFWGEAPFGLVFSTGLLYVGYNLAGLPSTLFVLDRQTSRRQALWAGAITGALSTVPFLLTWLAILAFYPQPAILNAEVPWLVMLGRVGGNGLLAFYALVILWTLVETSVGMIHAVVDRISATRIEAGGSALTPRQVAVVTVGLLVTAALLSRWGIIALVARGYSLMAYGFLILFAAPLLTRGLAMVMRRERR